MTTLTDERKAGTEININDETITKWLGEESYQRKLITLQLTTEINRLKDEVKRLTFQLSVAKDQKATVIHSGTVKPDKDNQR